MYTSEKISNIGTYHCQNIYYFLPISSISPYDSYGFSLVIASLTFK